MAHSLQVQRDNFTILGLTGPGKCNTRTVVYATALLFALGASLALSCRLSPAVRAFLAKDVPLWSLPLTLAITAFVMNRVIARRNGGVILFADDPILAEFRKLFAIEAKRNMGLENREIRVEPSTTCHLKCRVKFS